MKSLTLLLLLAVVPTAHADSLISEFRAVAHPANPGDPLAYSDSYWESTPGLQEFRFATSDAGYLSVTWDSTHPGNNGVDIDAHANAAVSRLTAELEDGIAQTTRLSLGGVTLERPEIFYMAPALEREVLKGEIIVWHNTHFVSLNGIDYQGFQIHSYHVYGIPSAGNPAPGGMVRFPASLDIVGSIPEPAAIWLAVFGVVGVTVLRRKEING